MAGSNHVPVNAMPLAPCFAQFRKTVGRFGDASGGNVAVIFGIALLPLVSLVGIAIDYSRTNNARTAMQGAMDSAALMVSKDLSSGIISTADIAPTAQKYFKALYNSAETVLTNFTAVYTTATSTTGSTIKLGGTGTIPSDFLQVIGFPDLSFGITSTASWGSTRLRVALALDNTGSMDKDGKITALKTAAKNLIDQLSPLAKNNGDVYISIIPFAKDVNLGATNYAQTFIDWTDWQAEAPDLIGDSQKPNNTNPNLNSWKALAPGSSCPWTMQQQGFTCVSGRGSTTAINSIPSSGANKGLLCPGPDANSNYAYKYHYLINGCYDTVNKTSGKPTWSPNAKSTWSGCFTDRTASYDITSNPPVVGTTNSLFPAEQYYENDESYCVSGNSPPLQPITPLSYDFATLKTQIDAMQPTGGTNQPIGLAWAWHSLSQGLPLNAPAEDSNYTYKKAIILLSDGLNTENRDPANGNGSTQTGTKIDDRQKLLCDNIKAVIDPKTNKSLYTIYTIHVNTGTPADPSSAVLKYCATSPENFFMLTSASQIVTAFNTIGTSLSKLRISN